MQDPIKVGIIGTGRHGSRYANHIVNDLQKSFRLVAISRRSPSAVDQAKAWHTTLYSDWRELVGADEVDAVISVTTPNLNVEIGEFCARWRKPLLLEKPLATDYYQAKRIVDAFSASGVSLTVAQTLRYNSVILAMKERLPQLGKLFSVSASQRLEPSTLSWLEEPLIAGGGIIFHTAVHLFDALRFITGDEIAGIRAVSRNVHNPRLEDLFVAELEMQRGALGIIDASKVSPSRAGGYQFVCERGQLHGEQIHGGLKEIRDATVTPLEVDSPGPTLLPLLHDWYLFLQGRGKNPIPAEEGLAAVRVCHACRQAAATGRWVDIEDL
ncbi:MAG: Gfo/Idh/MocA family protein [Desulforhopalus sp.]